MKIETKYKLGQIVYKKDDDGRYFSYKIIEIRIRIHHIVALGLSHQEEAFFIQYEIKSPNTGYSQVVYDYDLFPENPEIEGQVRLKQELDKFSEELKRFKDIIDSIEHG